MKYFIGGLIIGLMAGIYCGVKMALIAIKQRLAGAKRIQEMEAN